MITNQPITPNRETSVELKPSFNIPVVLILLAVPLFFVQVGVSLVVGIFGVFLLVQTMTLRLRFTEEALEIYRLDKEIRNFPYSEWQNYEIFWSAVPILFYFREVKSIHFLPIIFDPKMLSTCLKERLNRLKIDNSTTP